jgi:hypothetical protein
MPPKESRKKRKQRIQQTHKEQGLQGNELGRLQGDGASSVQVGIMPSTSEWWLTMIRIADTSARWYFPSGLYTIHRSLQQ